MRIASICSGIGGAELAFDGLGTHAFASEIDPFARAVLRQHFPHIPLHGDFTEITADAGPIDVLVGGTPCQSFSIAGLRGGMVDARGNLALEFLRLAERLRTTWILWENVPGVLSSNEGRDFGAFIGGLAELGYGYCWRVLDAQFFGLAQRRKRVFVVGCLGDWRRAAAVLLEPACLRGNPPPRRETRERTARPLASCALGSSGYRNDADTADNLVAHTLRPLSHDASWRGDGADNLVAYGGNRQSGHPDIARSLNAHPSRIDGETETFVTHSLRADGFDAGEDGTGRGTPLVAFDARQSDVISYGDQSGPLDTCGHSVAVAYSIMPQNSGRDYKARPVDVAQPVMGNGPVGGNQGGDYIVHGTTSESDTSEAGAAAPLDWRPGVSAVRRLTPRLRECEKLQGYPDGWTDIPFRGRPAADGNRYRALGNAFAVPVVRWIARRIAAEASE